MDRGAWRAYSSWGHRESETTDDWAWPSRQSTSIRIKSWAAAAAGIQHPVKGALDGGQEWGSLCPQKNWQNSLSDRYFSEDFMSPVLASPHIEKHSDHYQWHLLLVANSKTLPKCVLDHTYPTSLKSCVTLTLPPTSLEQFLRAIWNAVSWTVVLILFQMKLNSQLSHCVFFSINTIIFICMYIYQLINR